MRQPGYLTAAEAAAALGVTPATLYAYTSRGQLHSEPLPGRPRERRYSREDVDRLRQRKEARRDPAKAVAGGLDWGSPVLDSSITLIHNGRLYYRGRDAIHLARSASLEAVAELLWEPSPGERLFPQPPVLGGRQLRRVRQAVDHPFTAMQAALPFAAEADVPAYDLRPAAVRQTGARILSLFTGAVTGQDAPAAVHEALAAAWGPRQPAVAAVIRSALVLCADHELNVSTFAARCAASAGCTPYDAVAAALATLRGHKHGGATERVCDLFAEAAASKRPRTLLENRLRRGERIPGFGHRFYPGGDPRAALLLDLAKRGTDRAGWQLARSLWKAAAALQQDAPTLDFALAAITRAYALPLYAPLVLFALGRTAGWIGHIIEQYALDKLIRPRARYVGPPPSADALTWNEAGD